MTSRRKSSGRLIAVVACAFAFGLLGSGSAIAAEPGSLSEAKEQGDPAATAPVISTPPVFQYNGEQVSEGEAMGLACMQYTEFYACKDSADEFAPGEEAGASRSRKGATASRACGVSALWLYRDKQYGGTEIGLGFFGAWYDVPAEMNNAASSYRTGEGQAHLSDFGGGGGFWYPGATGVCDFHSNINQPYPEWNDRISSRYRF